MKKFLFLFTLLQTYLFSQDYPIEFGFSGAFLYLQPNASNLIYAIQADPKNPALAVPLVEANWIDHEFDPHYHPALEIGAFLGFKEMAMHLSLDWEHFSTSENRRISVPNGEAMLGPLFDIGPDASEYIHARGKLDISFDDISLLFEKQVFCKQCWVLDFCVGIACTRIQEKTRNSYTNDGATIARVLKKSSQFLGIGPRFGVHFDFFLPCHFRFIGGSYASLFMGQLKNHSAYQSFSPDLITMNIPQPNTEQIHVPNRMQLIPGFEERLGFAYDFLCCQNPFSIEIGYLFQMYFNAIESLDITVIVNANDLPFSSTVGYYAQGFQRSQSNFILTGPYLKLNMCF